MKGLYYCSMEGVIYNTEGNGLIRIVYDGATSYLEIDKAIIAVNIDGPYQNFYNGYFIQGNFSSDCVNCYLKQVNFDFYTYYNFFSTKNHQIEQFLSYFEPGSYYVARADNFFISILESDYELASGSFDTQSYALLFTRNYRDLNRDTIDNYKNEIAQGREPVIFSYRKNYENGSETGGSFIIDGHCKLIAYRELGIKPNVWEIVQIVKHNYDPTNQVLCSYLDKEEIKTTSLKSFYHFKENKFGEVCELVCRN